MSEVAGTTTDPVKKAMEIPGLGPCVFIDTAGFDDVGDLGRMRVAKTKKAIEKTDIALVVFCHEDISMEIEWIDMLRKLDTPFIPIVNKSDILTDEKALRESVEKACGVSPILASAKQGTGIEEIRREIIRQLPEGSEEDITGDLVGDDDLVLLVMPQDIEAPKGRLILPQVQTIRELLDKKCVVICSTEDRMDSALGALAKPPALIITDSQVFPSVYARKPRESKLTSFSVLFAKYKGDLSSFMEGAGAIDDLNENSRVLIAEACTHAPLGEDIGRVKLPALLRRKVGPDLHLDIVSGSDFPEDLSSYDLIIHCGACMFNRKHVLSRILQAKNQEIPITNYGVVLAKLSGILDQIDF